MNINMKKLSDYNATEGMQIISKLNRAIAPHLKDKKLMKKVTDCVKKFNHKNAEESQVATIVGIVDIVTGSASELLFEIVAIMGGTDKETLKQANWIDFLNAIMQLKDDEKFMELLTKRFEMV